MDSAKCRCLWLGNVIAQVLLLTFVLLILSLKAEGGIWTPAGGPDGALVKQLAISPNYIADQTIVAISGSPSYGILFKSTNGGSSWFPLNTGNKGLDTVAFSPNYAVDQTIFAGGPVGVLKTTNGGTTWNSIMTNVYTTTITISPNYSVDQTIFAATNFEILKSTDGGMSWLNITPAGVCAGCGIGYSSIATSPNYAIDRTVFATISAPSYMTGLYKSTDGGNSWNIVNTASNTVNAVFLSPNFVTDQTLFAFSSSVIIKSIDGGTSWSVVSTGLPNGLVKSVAVSPNQTLFVGMNAMHSDWNTVQGLGIFKSTDGGISWTAVNTGLTNLEVNSIALSPNYTVDQTLFAGTYDREGLFKSTNGGTSWTLANTGLAGLFINSVALSPNYPVDHTIFSFSFPFSGTYYGSLSSPGSFFKSVDGGTTWTVAISGMTLGYGISNSDIASVSVSPSYSSDQTLFSAQYGKSIDGGATWTPINIIAQNGLLSFAFSPQFSVDHTIFAINAHNSLCFYCNNGGYVFKSTNGGVSWEIVMVMSNNPLGGSTIALSPNFQVDQTVFVGNQYSGFFRSTDGGTTWYQVNIETGLSIEALEVSPNYSSDQTIFAGTTSGIYKSTNGGASWTAINNGLTNLDYWVNSLAISPNFANDQTIFAGTNWGGVFKSTDGGTTWNSINTGLSISNIRSLAISPGYPCDGTLFAGTEGASVWKYTDTEAMATCAPIVHSIIGKAILNNVGVGGITMTLSGATSATTTTANDGTYSFPNLGDGNYTITPTLNGYTFTPASKSITVAGADVTGVDFTASLANRPPILDPIGPKSINEGSPLTFTISGSDPDGDSLTYSASQLPSGATFDPVTRTFSWTPDYTQAGLYSVTFTVSDGSLAASETVAIAVLIPDFTITPQTNELTITQGGLDFTVITLTDLYGNFTDSVLLTVSGLPEGASAVFSSPELVPTASSALSIITALTTPPGTYTLELYAEGGGQTHVASIQLDVRLSYQNVSWEKITGPWSSDYDETFGAIASHPSNPDVIFIGSSVNGPGVFKTTDGGKTWTEKNSGIIKRTFTQNYPPISKIIISPNNPNVLYLGTADDLGLGQIYKSTDGGETWQNVDINMGLITLQGSVWDIAVDPQDPNVVYTSIQSKGVFKTSNGGLSWDNIYNGGTNAYFNIVRTSPTKSNTIYIAGFTTDEGFTLCLSKCLPQYVGGLIPIYLQRSSDGGYSWETLSTNIDITVDLQINSSSETIYASRTTYPTPATNICIYVGNTCIGGSNGVIKSLDGGSTWESIDNASPYNLSNLNTFYLTLDPTLSQRLFLTAPLEGIFLSEDSGDNWRLLSGFPPSIVFGKTATAGDKLFVLTSAGIFVSTPQSYTPSGSNVTVSPGSGTTVSFSAVSSPGDTMVTVNNTGPASPSGFLLGNPPSYYDITTTATYTPPVTVCLEYGPAQFINSDMLRLFHYENNVWLDVTTSNDTANRIICGQVSSLSPFAILEPDTIPPIITASISQPPNAAGWHNTDVTVSFTCSDTGSGIETCTPPAIVSTDGAGQVISGTATDKAGNSALVSVMINLDKTPPAITASLSMPTNASDWHNGDVTVTFNCNDTESGVATCPSPVVVSIEGSGQVISGTAVDKAGSGASTSVTINLDKTAPVMTCPLNTEILAMELTGTSSTNSGVQSFLAGASATDNLTPAVSITNNAPSLFPLGQTIVTFTATDNAGNKSACQSRVNVISPKTNSNGSSSYFSEGGYNAYATFDVKYVSGTPSGNLTFSSTKTRRKIVSTGITSLTVTGKTAVFTGPCTLNGVSGYNFTATVGDNATPGAGKDTFAITVTGPNGFSYSASGTIISGEYNVSQ